MGRVVQGAGSGHTLLCLPTVRHTAAVPHAGGVGEYTFLKQGFTEIKAAKDDATVKQLATENQLGWLWRNHYINGANL